MAIQPDASFWQAAQAILQGLGAPITATNLQLVAAWSYCEKPHGSGAAWEWNNPLNTTQPGFGGSVVPGDWNTAGVKQYPTQTAGIQATVATLTNGDYPVLVQALQQSNPSLFFSAQGWAEIQTWGTDPTCIQSVFASLAAPPAQYLGASSPTPAPPGPVFAPPPALSPPGANATAWILLGGGLLLLGGAAALHAKTAHPMG